MPRNAGEEVGPGLYLYKAQEKRTNGQVIFVLELENRTGKIANFALDFSRSENLKVSRDGSGLCVLSIQCGPHRKTFVGKLETVDPNEPACFEYQSSHDFVEPNELLLRKMVDQDNQAIQKILATSRRLGLNRVTKTTQEIEQMCTVNHTLFVDLDFPPTQDSLCGQGMFSDEHVTWRRPRDFFRGSYQVFSDGIEPNDIRQGALTDCWFLSVVASLAEFPALVKALFESHEVSQAGVYRVRLCANGQWQWITLDDYFPCFPGAGPIYSTSYGNELWVLLLEKAYAKFYGSYHALRMGVAYEAMVDLTGCPWQVIELAPSQHNQLESQGEEKGCEGGMFFAAMDSSELWVNILRWDIAGYLMSVQTDGEDNATEEENKLLAEEQMEKYLGLIPGHCYTLLKAKLLSSGEKLVQLRNPWGQFEWTGDWSDNSPQWTEDARIELGVEDFSDDGTFWMSFQDLCKHFINLSVSQVRLENPWGMQQRRKVCFSYDRFNKTVSTPMFILMNEHPMNTVYFSIHQEDQRRPNAQNYMDVGVTILEICPDFSFRLVCSSEITCDRQKQTEAVLNPGQYLVIPVTTGCKFTQESAVQTSQLHLPSLFEGESEGASFSVDVSAALKEIFFRLDMDLDGLLSRQELNHFMELTEGYEMPEEIYLWLTANFDCLDGSLTQDGFFQIYKYMWQDSGRDSSIIWRDLEYLGYDRSLRLVSARSAMLVIHADKDIELIPQAFDVNAYEEAMELPVKKWGEQEVLDEGRIRIYIHRALTGATIAAENCHSKDLNITVDCSEGARNLMSHRGQLCESIYVPSKETKIVHHLMPQDTFSKWTWSYSIQYRWVE